MIKKIIFYTLFVLLLVYMIIVLTFVCKNLCKDVCLGTQIDINNTNNGSFLWDDDVLSIVEHDYGYFKDSLLVNIDKDSIERVLNKFPIIKKSEVYSSLDGIIHIYIEQKIPVLRVFGRDNYYIDEEGGIMSLSKRYSARVVVATGNISRSYAKNELYHFVMFIRNNDFWNSFIEQIYIKNSDNVILIPKVGMFKINIGSIDNYKENLNKLYLFLIKGIEKKGWNSYKEINLKFKKQVVCVKR